MGLFDALKGEDRRVFIARPDEFKGDIIYKHPDQNIRYGTQLTVEPDEVTLFIRDGQVVGTIGPGRHTLESTNYPFLGMLVDAVTGGNLFVTEVYFVTTREVSQIKFGGPIGDVRDPETGLAIGTMVHGDFSVKVTDPQQLVIGLVGLQRTTNDAFMGWFKNLLLKTIRDDVAELLVKKKWPLLDVTSGAYTEEIETEVISGAKEHIDGYGLTVVRLGNFNIGIKPEDEQTLKKFSKDVAYSRVAGGFQQYAAGAAMLGAGEGMAKGGGAGGGGNPALGGAGLGVGFGMAQMFMGQQGQQQQQAPQAAAAGAAGAAAAAPSLVTCPACNAQVPQGKFCANCGQELPAAQAGPKFCSNCGKPLAPGAKFCAECGTAAG